MFDASPFSTKPALTARLAAVLLIPLRLLLPRPRPLHPHLMPALLLQAQRLRSVHQLHQLHSLAACWLAAPQLRALHPHLQAAMVRLANNPQSPKSTLSRTRTARRTGKRRR